MSGNEESRGTTGKSRPNAAYNLSNKTQPDEELNFRYSREQRLAKATQAVRDLNDPAKKPKFSLLRPLIASRGRAVLFGSIMIICAALLVISFFDRSGAYELDGNSIEAQAVKYEGAIIVVLKKNTRKNAAAPYTGAVEIGASAVVDEQSDTVPFIFPHRIFFTEQDTEEYRFSVPFESDFVLLVLQTETGTQVSMRIKAE